MTARLTTGPRVLEAASSSFGFVGEVLHQVEFGGARVAVVLELVEEEHRRRQDEHLGAVDDRDLWEVLANLPHGERIPWASIEPIAATKLDTIPSGIVRADSNGVERIIRPAVRISGVLSVDSHWRPAIDRVSRFSAHGSRAAIVLKPTSKQGIQRARRLGIGLAVASGQRLDLELRPAPTSPIPGPRNFRFCEAVYEVWLRTRTTRTVPTP